MRPGKRRALSDTQDGRVQDMAETAAKAHIRSKVEHPIRVIKQKFGFQKTRLRGLPREAAKSTCWQNCRIPSRLDGNY
jgi:IS5 family transposase